MRSFRENCTITVRIDLDIKYGFISDVDIKYGFI